MTTEGDQRTTPLYDEHRRLGARIVPFAGFLLPVQYSSVIEEHRAVRTAAGLFDVSHMGEIAVAGERALDFVQRATCNDHSKMAVGRAQYTGLMYPEGTFVDDMLVHRTGEDDYLLVVNAANTAKDFAYLAGLAATEDGVTVEDRSPSYAQIALQGPAAAAILAPLTDAALAELKYYRFTTGMVAGVDALIARTGYTGEDGFELYVTPSDAAAVWRAVLEAGRPHGALPAGLGARDTLRFEAGMCLYGNDIDATTTPLEAGLGWIVKLGKGDFIGRDVLERQHEEGVERRLVGLELVGRGIARHGYPVFLSAAAAEVAGTITSGTHSPTLERALAMAYVPSDAAELGRSLWVGVRKRRVEARVVELPFYSRKKKGARGK